MDAADKKPHLVILPFPMQGHIKPMLDLAKLLHHKGFYITFVNTEYNHRRFLRAGGSNLHRDLPDDFRFETMPDGLPPSDANSTQDLPSLNKSLDDNGLTLFLDVLAKIKEDVAQSRVPPITCIVADGFMSIFSVEAGQHVGVPVILFWAIAAYAVMGAYDLYVQTERDQPTFKDESYLTLSNGSVETVKPTNPNDDLTIKHGVESAKMALRAFGNIVHTLEALEANVLNKMSLKFPGVHAIGPFQLHLRQIPDEEDKLRFFNYHLWKEESECLSWLDSKAAQSVLYVNFGSTTLVTKQQLTEFAMGLANSQQNFLWVIRPDLIIGESAILPPDFAAGTKDSGLIVNWCPQEKVLDHPSIGGFLTHCGWNSSLESLYSGVPVIGWPFLGDQSTNCKFLCTEWEVGMEIDKDVKREEVEKLVRLLMEGEKGKKMKEKAMEWKKLAQEATSPNGSSTLSLQNLINKVLLLSNQN